MEQDTPRDIVDRIGELVDQQLDGGEPYQGCDFGDPTFPRCPHCGRHWHGLPLTECIAAMYSRGVFDDDYRLDQDDSPVLCQGSGFIGPMPAGCEPRPMLQQLPTGVIWLDDLIAHTNCLLAEMVTGAPLPPRPRNRWQWWRLMAAVFRRARDDSPALQVRLDREQSSAPTEEDTVSASMHQLSYEIFEASRQHRHRVDDPEPPSR